MRRRDCARRTHTQRGAAHQRVKKHLAPSIYGGASFHIYVSSSFRTNSAGPRGLLLLIRGRFPGIALRLHAELFSCAHSGYQ